MRGALDLVKLVPPGDAQVVLILAAEALARMGTVDTERERKRAETLAVRATSEALGNTPAVARASYIDPRVFRRYARGDLLDLSVRPESAIRKLILG